MFSVFLVSSSFSKSVKCRRCLLFYLAAILITRGFYFLIPFQYFKVVSTELRIHGSFLCTLFTVDI